MKWNLLVVLVIGALLGANANDETDKELEKLQGTWILVSVETKGQALPKDKIVQNTLVISGQRFIPMSGGKVLREATFKIDVTKNPKWIDQISQDKDGKSAVRPGLYELNGETLRLAFDRERPMELKTTTDSNLNITVYEREKK